MSIWYSTRLLVYWLQIEPGLIIFMFSFLIWSTIVIYYMLMCWCAGVLVLFWFQMFLAWATYPGSWGWTTWPAQMTCQCCCMLSLTCRLSETSGCSTPWTGLARGRLALWPGSSVWWCARCGPGATSRALWVHRSWCRRSLWPPRSDFAPASDPTA